MVKRSLTDATVKRIKPPAEGQLDVFDRGFPGLALRLSYGGRKSFVYFYKIGGRLRRMSLGTYPAISLADARNAWREARQDAQAGRDPAIARKHQKGATDFRSVAEEWLRRDQGKNRSRAAVERLIVKDVLPVWSYRPMGGIGRRDVLDVIDSVVDRGSPITARRLHAHLHRLFEWSMGRGIIAINPMMDLPKPSAETKRDRVLNDRELVAVWNAAAAMRWPFGDAVRLLILTGARRQEIAGLHWSEIDDGQISLSGGRTKNGEPLIIPLSRPAEAIIEAAPRIAGSDLVFTTNGKTAISGWSKVRSRLQAEAKAASPWTLHDLRRSVSTGMNELGIEPYIVEAILGHKIRGVAAVYNRAKHERAKRAALETWGSHVVALVGGQKPATIL